MATIKEIKKRQVAVFDFAEIKRAVSISRYLTDRGITVTNGRCAAVWRGGDGANVSIDDEKGVWHDHKQNEGGYLLKLCTMVENAANAKEAANILGARYNITPKEAQRNFHEVDTYIYRDENGTPLYCKTRFEFDEYNAEKGEYEHKKITPFYHVGADGKRGEKGKPDGVAHELYLLPELIKGISEGKTVYIVEGEKDAKNLYALGFVATSSKEWERNGARFAERFKGAAKVLIVADNDAKYNGTHKGDEIAGYVRSALAAVGVDAPITYTPEGKDITDFLRFKCGGNWKKATDDQRREAVAAVADLAEHPLPYDYETARKEAKPTESGADEDTSKDAADWLNEEDEPDNPLIKGLVECGSYCAIVGPAKAAKSQLALLLSVCVAAGVPFLAHEVKRQRVYYANIEISPKQCKKRLRAICKRLGVSFEDLRGWLFIENKRGHKATFEGCRKNAERRGASVVILDPFYQLFKGQETNEADCQAANEEIKKFLALGMSVFIVFHAPKGFSGDRQIVDMISGSAVLVRFPENVIAILPHATDKNARVVDCSVLRDYPPPEPFAVQFVEGALELAPDITPELKSGQRFKPFKSADERDAEKVKRHNAIQDQITNSAEEFLEGQGGELIGSIQFAEILKSKFPKNEVENYIKAAKESGDLCTVEERISDGAKGWKVMAKKQGGKTFISLPKYIQQYRDNHPLAAAV